MNNILFRTDGSIGSIILNRPEKRNALDPETVGELKDALLLLDSDPLVKVIVLKAIGPAFCSGADLAHLQKLQGYTEQENLMDSVSLKDLFLQIYSMKTVVIAQIQGHALAGGCGLASVCDFVFAVPEAKFGYTEVKIGFVPAIVMTFLVRKIGEGPARALLLSGDVITAKQALEYRMVNGLVDGVQLDQYVREFATKLVESNSAQAMSITKQLLARVQSMPLEDGLNQAAETNSQARMTDDCKRGIEAFLKKQPISW